MATDEAVLVGSGINALVAAALLAKAGWQVQVLERNDRLGGAIQTAEITVPDFQRHVFSAWHPLFVEPGAVGLSILSLSLHRAGGEADLEIAL